MKQIQTKQSSMKRKTKQHEKTAKTNPKKLLYPLYIILIHKCV